MLIFYRDLRFNQRTLFLIADVCMVTKTRKHTDDFFYRVATIRDNPRLSEYKTSSLSRFVHMPTDDRGRARGLSFYHAGISGRLVATHA